MPDTTSQDRSTNKRVYFQAYKTQHAERLLEQHRIYNQDHLEERREKARQYHADHAEERRAYQKDYRKKNPGKRMDAQRRRRAYKKTGQKGQTVRLTVIYARDKGRCSICHQHVKRSEASVDHIVPLSHGGQHTYRNCVLAHCLCNVRKSNRRTPPQQFNLF